MKRKILFYLVFMILLVSCSSEVSNKITLKTVPNSELIEVSLCGDISEYATKSLYATQFLIPNMIKGYVYKAIPDFQYVNEEEVFGKQEEFTTLTDNLKFAQGMWTFVIGAIDENGTVIYQGSERISVTKTVDKQYYVIILKPAMGTGTLYIDVTVPQMSRYFPDLELYYGIIGQEVHFANGFHSESIPYVTPADGWIKMVHHTMTIEYLPTGMYCLNFRYCDKEVGERSESGNTIICEILNGHTTMITGDILSQRQYCFVDDSAEFYSKEWIEGSKSFVLKYSTIDEYAQKRSNLYLDNQRCVAKYFYTKEGIIPEIEASGDDVILEDTTLYVHRLAYNLNWDISEQDEVLSTYSPNGQYYWNTNIQPPLLQRKGYTFTGWNPSFSYDKSGNMIMPAHDVTYCAQWEANTVE